MTPASGSKRPRKGAKRPEPFIIEATRGGVAVYRRPVGNLAIPRLCGVLPTRQQAVEFARLLARAESAAPDLFLEATDDGIEALDAVIAACMASATAGGKGGRQRSPRRRPGRNGNGPEGGEPEAGERAEAGTPSSEAAAEGVRGRNAGRRRGRRGRGPRRGRGEPGGEGTSGSSPSDA